MAAMGLGQLLLLGTLPLDPFDKITGYTISNWPKWLIGLIS